MAGGSSDLQAKSSIVDVPAGLSAPSVHPVADDASALRAMAAPFDLPAALGLRQPGEAGASEARTGSDRGVPVGAFWRVAWPFFLSALPALVTLIALTLRLFPWLEPVAPPEARSVTITDLAFAERNRVLGDGVVANAVLFEVETLGYDAGDASDDIAVDWLVLDAATRQRLAEQPDPKRWGTIVFGTRSDRVVGEILVPPPADHAGCVFVRVRLQPLALANGTVDATPGAELMLDVADTRPFDPHDPENSDCPDAPDMAEATA
jgi:hypothetical protein